MIESTNRADSSGDIGRTMRTVGVIGFGAAIVAMFIVGPRAAVSIALGAALGAGNLWIVARLVRGFLSSDGPKASWTVLALIKFSALFGVVLLLLATGFVELMPLIIGYGALPLGIVSSQLLLTPRSQEKG